MPHAPIRRAALTLCVTLIAAAAATPPASAQEATALAEPLDAGLTPIERARLEHAVRDLELTDRGLEAPVGAMNVIADLGPRAATAAVPALVDLFDTPYAYMATSVLQVMGPAAAEAAPALVALLRSSRRAGDATPAVGAVQALAAIGPAHPDVVLALREALHDELPTLRYYAAHALGGMGEKGRTAIPDLQAVLQDDAWVPLYMYPHGRTVGEAARRALAKLFGGERAGAPGAGARQAEVE